jgi:hypothetical protein
MRYSPTFIFLIVILISRTCLSKNHEDDKLREIAINAARSNSCFDTYNGKLDTRITIEARVLRVGLSRKF